MIAWVKAEVKKIEQKDAVKTVIAKLKESNSQGDSIASIGKLIVSDVVKAASTNATLKPFVEKLTALHADAVAIWEDEDGSDEQMAAVVKAANDIYGILESATKTSTTSSSSSGSTASTTA